MEEKFSKFPPGTRGNDRLGNTRERQIGLSPPSVPVGGIEEKFSMFPPGTRGNPQNLLALQMWHPNRSFAVSVNTQ